MKKVKIFLAIFSLFLMFGLVYSTNAFLQPVGFGGKVLMTGMSGVVECPNLTSPLTIAPASITMPSTPYGIIPGTGGLQRIRTGSYVLGLYRRTLSTAPGCIQVETATPYLTFPISLIGSSGSSLPK
ncbi:hypothetical protein KC842_01135 [Candidatus Nomurabacteria bacterium]|nr:hypothetical protein [Candidatus Nomurabacteria bacterium]